MGNLEGYLQPSVYLPVLIGLVLIAAYYVGQNRYGWFKKTESSRQTLGDRKKDELGAPNTKGEVLCRIADNITARIYNAFITKEQAKAIIKEHGTIGRQWHRDTEKLYGLNRYEEKGVIKLKPILPPAEITNAPTELYNDMQHPELEIIMEELENEDSKPFLEKYGVFLWWIAVMGFLAFIWANS